jgi:hypothetical protein
MSSAIKRAAQDLERRIANAAMREDRRKRRGPLPLPPGEAREHMVSVRLNSAELAELDRQRAIGGNAKRGEWLRMAWTDQKPDTRIPELNAQAYAALARSAANLNQIARYIHEGGDVKCRMQIIEQELSAFRASLIRAQEIAE